MESKSRKLSPVPTKELLKITYAPTCTSPKAFSDPHLSSNKAGSLGRADHDPAEAKLGL